MSEMRFFAAFLIITFRLHYCLTDDVHPHRIYRDVKVDLPEAEMDNSFWDDKAQAQLTEKLSQIANQNLAKNVIFFLGDGMSVVTIAAARAYQAELNGLPRSGGDPLSFEKFPYSGFSKTYCVDSKVTDSAASATAYLGGVKANYGTIGVNGHVIRDDCEAMNNKEYHVESIAKWFQDAGRSTGIVTTTRVTHASPAGTYAHIANRDWESDANLVGAGLDPTICKDIAFQLVSEEPGRNFDVILGGGRGTFLPLLSGGYRLDRQNLVDVWNSTKNSSTTKYVTDREGLLNLDTSVPDYLLGLFSKDHMDYHLENTTTQPTLAEMTEAALKVLLKKNQGFFLFVEGGKIDLAHHENLAHYSLDETVEFAKAIELARNLTDEQETLIVVTADHSHTATYNGYPSRETSIFGFGGNGADFKPYTILSYGNGPGYKWPVNGQRPNLSDEDTGAVTFKFPATVPLLSETHGGEDVAIFANGPWAHLFTGSVEENFIPHAMAYAACVGKGQTWCK